MFKFFLSFSFVFILYYYQNEGLRTKLKQHEVEGKNLDEEILLRERAEKLNQELMEEMTEAKSEADKHVRFNEERYVLYKHLSFL
jgi:hypothetical protein